MSSARIHFLPKQSCDCHAHVFDPQRFAYAPDRAYTPGQALVPDLQALHRLWGVARVVLVQPSVYGADNACLLDAIAQFAPGQARGIAVVDLRTVSDETLHGLHEGGVRGIRLNLHVGGGGIQAAKSQLAQARRLGDLPGWHVQVHASLDLNVALLDAFDALGMPVVLDHFAGGMPSDPACYGTFSSLLAGVSKLPLHVKLSAAYRLPAGAPVERLVTQLYDAGPDKLVWASDWPHTGGSGGAGRNPHAVEPFRDIDNIAALQRILMALGSDTAIQHVFVDNPARLYGF